MPYRTLDGFGEAKRAALLAEAEATRLALGATPLADDDGRDAGDAPV